MIKVNDMRNLSPLLQLSVKDVAIEQLLPEDAFQKQE